MSELKKQVISTIKWTWLIAFASIAFYKVVPKYERFQFESYNDGSFLLNKVTGDRKSLYDGEYER